MKVISQALAAHLAGATTTIAMLWKLTRQDGVTFGFTDHDLPITFHDDEGDTVVYSPSDGVTGSATTTSSTDTGNQEITGFLEDETITEADIFAGLYDYAIVEIRIVNWNDLTMGALLWKKATIGQVQFKNGMFQAELRGLEYWLSVNMGEEYGPQCRADLFDEQCTKDSADYIQEGVIVSAADLRTCVITGVGSPDADLVMRGSPTPDIAAPPDWFGQGTITFLTGLNAGLTMDIMTYDGAQILLFENMPYTVQAGDLFNILPGCDKLIQTCNDKFQNVDNHRGEPFIPGMDQILIYPNAGGTIPAS